MKIGKFDLKVVETGLFGLDGGAMFGVVPKALWAKAYHPGDELNRIPLSARPLLIEFDDRKVLIDTGNGTKWNEKLKKIYNIDTESASIEKALAPLGVKPEDVTDVIFTHLHFDHSGGSTREENGKIVPTFPNAKHYVQKEHLAWALNPTDKDKASFFPENYEPLVAEGLMETIDGAGEIFPGIGVEPVFGHTKAMQSVKITGGGKSVFYAADVIPTSAHVPVPYVMGYDNNPLIAIEEKKRYLPQAYEEDWIVFYEHDAFAQASKIQSTPKGFVAGEKIQISEYKP